MKIKIEAKARKALYELNQKVIMSSVAFFFKIIILGGKVLKKEQQEWKSLHSYCSTRVAHERNIRWLWKEYQ